MLMQYCKAKFGNLSISFSWNRKMYTFLWNWDLPYMYKIGIVQRNKTTKVDATWAKFKCLVDKTRIEILYKSMYYFRYRRIINIPFGLMDRWSCMSTFLPKVYARKSEKGIIPHTTEHVLFYLYETNCDAAPLPLGDYNLMLVNCLFYT